MKKTVFVFIHKNDLSDINDSLKWILNGYQQGTVFFSEEEAKSNKEYKSHITKGFVLKSVDIKIY